MKRLLPLVLLLAACEAPQVTTGTPIEVSAHCGIEETIVVFEGREWLFADAEPLSQPPPGWDDGNTVYVERVDGELVAHGPDGRDWRLIEKPPAASFHACL
jgi:hypothetical protein